ncbi:hypothetical protein [Aureliella helgolandensis]|uniref:Glycoside hydrolase family 5 domain-containing protein n=1 Tax=Aureliella helgolandensis TaxID=2527968 RepID=A0A518G174_9BACT|nr:hypothetical protein [Aureliella helgolandensis]QDV22355.1 hypothetical protein Q31a_06390 [Aureliella helgolandensis]
MSTPPIRWLALACVMICFLPHTLRAQAPSKSQESHFQLHPDNSRYFLFRGKPTVLVTSAEHYGVLLNRKFDFEAYFAELSSHGLNHSRVFSGVYREIIGSFGITQNPLAPLDRDYLSPWARATHGKAGDERKFDLEQWDPEYFERLHALVASASRHAIVLELTLFCPMYEPALWDVNPMNVRNNVNGVGDCSFTECYSVERQDLLDVQIRLVEKLVAELAPYDNLYYEVCNEPYVKQVPEAWQRRIIDAIVAAQDDVGCQKLISINVANGSARVVEPHPAISLFNFHYCHPPKAVAENWHLNKAIGENETGFRGAADFIYRTEGWDFMLAGGALYNNLDYSFSAEHPDGSLTGYKSPGGGSRALRSQLGLLKRSLETLPLTQLEPQTGDFVSASMGLQASAIGSAKHGYLVYVHVALPGKLKNMPLDEFRQPIAEASLTMQLPEGKYQVFLLDPRSGSKTELEVISSRGGPVTLPLPTFRTDTALLLIRQ